MTSDLAELELPTEPSADQVPDADTLLAEARAAMRNAHAPYSEFQVGAALLGAGGGVFLGANVENASYGLTLCAEMAAVAAGVAGGERDFRVLAIVNSGSEPVAPCGACRQLLSEFAADSMWIVSGTAHADDRGREQVNGREGSPPHRSASSPHGPRTLRRGGSAPSNDSFGPRESWRLGELIPAAFREIPA